MAPSDGAGGAGRSAGHFRNEGTSKSSSSARSTSADGPPNRSSLAWKARGRLAGGQGQVGGGGALPALVPAVEAGGDDGDPHLVAHGVVDDHAGDDVGVGVGHLVDDLGRLVDLEQAEVAAAGDVEQDAAGALDGGLEQRAGDGGPGRVERPGPRPTRSRCP